MKLDDLLKQARNLQTQLSDVQEALNKSIVTGESGAGLVKIKLNGRHEAVGVEIDPAAFGDDRALLEDLIAAAFNDAVHRVEAKQKEHMGSLAKGMNLPGGLKLPF